MDVMEKYVMQKVNKKEKSICPKCIHRNLCIAENNQPCFECNRFIDAHGVTVQEWIPVTERLPEKWGEYLVMIEGDKTSTTLYYEWADKYWFDFPNGRKFVVTHWMPVPEPPKEDAE